MQFRSQHLVPNLLGSTFSGLSSLRSAIQNMMNPQRRPCGFNLVDSLLAIIIIEGLLRLLPRAVLTTQHAMFRIGCGSRFLAN